VDPLDRLIGQFEPLEAELSTGLVGDGAVTDVVGELVSGDAV